MHLKIATFLLQNILLHSSAVFAVWMIIAVAWSQILSATSKIIEWSFYFKQSYIATFLPPFLRSHERLTRCEMINVRYPNHVMIDASSSKVEEDEEETFDGKVRHVSRRSHQKRLSFSLLRTTSTYLVVLTDWHFGMGRRRRWFLFRCLCLLLPLFLISLF